MIHLAARWRLRRFLPNLTPSTLGGVFSFAKDRRNAGIESSRRAGVPPRPVETPKAGAPDEIEITPRMIQAGLSVFYASGVVDGPSGEDSCADSLTMLRIWGQTD